MITADTVILLPAHNEEKSIGKVIDDIIRAGFPNVVVSLSACTDKTAIISYLHGAQIIYTPKGKGRAVKEAFRQIRANKVIMMDSDSTYPVKSIFEFLAKLDKYDIVAGARNLSNSNMSRLNRWGNRFITYQACVLYGLPIRDLCTGMWGFRGDVVNQFNIRSKGFTLEAELYVCTARDRLSFADIPIEYYPRIGEKKIKRLDHLKIMWYLWSRSFV